MVGRLAGVDGEFPAAETAGEKRQSPLLRTAQLNIALEEERMIVGKLIVAGRAIFVSDNLSCDDCESGENVLWRLRTIAGNDEDCI